MQERKIYLSNIIINTGVSQPFHELSIVTVNRPLQHRDPVQFSYALK